MDTTNSGNLIGAFGVGFYSRYLSLYTYSATFEDRVS